jgi:hypothetical protein
VVGFPTRFNVVTRIASYSLAGFDSREFLVETFAGADRTQLSVKVTKVEWTVAHDNRPRKTHSAPEHAHATSSANSTSAPAQRRSAQLKARAKRASARLFTS